MNLMSNGNPVGSLTEKQHKHKTIPKSVKLDGLSLAVWLMDDGAKSYNSVYLNCQQFNRNDQKLLQKKLFDQWGIKTTINKDKQYFRIRVRVESIRLLKKIVEPYILPSFRYKLPL